MTERLAAGTGVPPPGAVPGDPKSGDQHPGDQHPGNQIPGDQIPGDQIARLGEALASFPTGVTLVMVADGRDDIGTTVSAFCPVSWSPPLVAVSLIAGSYPAEVLRRAPRFAVTVLSAGAMRSTLQELAQPFEKATGNRLVLAFATAGQ